jgi:DNA invertase Pin-like site-specific DNA recombinase
MSEKIQPHHRDRQAYVYVRQSTMNQVRNHLESQRRQYDLEERAGKLGFQRVIVVDDDLGRSGTGSVDRPGFSRLLTAVCSGEVGAVLALEASRLARNNRDWHHLIDLCAMAGTLVIDHDGIYDPRLLNDRLLLGLKGTMSEFEISLLRQRALEAHREKVRRGKVLTLVPVGYVRTEDDGMEITPDRQVQEAVRGIFQKFRELGSIRQVLLWYRNEKLPIPVLGQQSGHRKVMWSLPVYPSLLLMLKNPTYAGAFVYGRRCTRTTVVDGRARKTRGHPRPQQNWEVFIPDHHAGYITWEQYMQNQEQIEANAGWSGRLQRCTGAPKSGPSLLAGLMRCGICGRPLHVKYTLTSRSRVPRYECRGDRKQCQVQRCLGFGGARVDQAVVAEVLEAIRPLGIKAALDAWDQSQDVEDDKQRHLTLALERARYEASRIERQYEATEPENRLVAAELEKRWNTALAHVTDLEDRVAAVKSSTIPLAEEQRQQLLALGEDLEQLWDHPACPIPLKKRILRTVLKEIVATEVGDPPQIFLKLHWAGGVHTELVLRKSQSGHHNRVNSREVIDLIRELAQVCDDAAIVGIMNRLGYRTGNENTWNEKRLQHVRHTHGIPPCPPPEERNWLTMSQAARIFNVSLMVVRRMIAQGILPARQVVKCAPWIIERADLELPVVRKEIRRVHEGRRGPLIVSDNTQTRLFTDSSEV